MMTAMVQIPFREDLLQQIDMFVEREEAESRADLILAATKMYVQRKHEWQNLFSYGEQFASEHNLSEDDIMNEIKSFRSSK